MINNVYWSSCKETGFCYILPKPEFSRQIFEIYSNIKFRENPSSGSRVVPCGQTDRQDEGNVTAAFRNSANAPKKTGDAREPSEKQCFFQKSGRISRENYFHFFFHFFVSESLIFKLGLRATSTHPFLSSYPPYKNVTPLPKVTSSTLQSYRDLLQQNGLYVLQQTPDATPGQFIATPRVYRTVKLQLGK